MTYALVLNEDPQKLRRFRAGFNRRSMGNIAKIDKMSFIYDNVLNRLVTFSTKKEGVEKSLRMTGIRLKIDRDFNTGNYITTLGHPEESIEEMRLQVTASTEEELYDKIFDDIENKSNIISFLMSGEDVEDFFDDYVRTNKNERNVLEKKIKELEASRKRLKSALKERS